MRLFQPIPKLRVDGSGRHKIDPNRLEIQRQRPRHTLQARGVAVDDRPARNRTLGDGAGGKDDGAARGGDHVLRRVLREKQRGEEAEHARLLHGAEVEAGDVQHSEVVGGGVHDVVQLVRAVVGGFVQDGDDLGVEGALVAEVDGVPGDAAFGGGVGGGEAGDGLFDLCGVGGGDDYSAAMLDEGFCDGEADAWVVELASAGYDGNGGASTKDDLPDEPPSTRTRLSLRRLVYLIWSVIVSDVIEVMSSGGF